jgi:HAD superfamily hydrolase (TIGR01456 family)
VGKKREYTTAIADSCGFKNYVLLEDFAAQHPLLCPWNKYAESAGPKDDQRIKAIFMTHEPVDWAEGLQVLCDILLAAGHLDTAQYRDSWRHHSQIPIFVANPDFTYSAQYKAPRFTSGAFLICLQNLYKELTQRELSVTVYGKPFPETYIYAQKLLHRMTGSDEPLHTVYAIGDNPLSDIKGGNSVGWFTILVRTGCFQGGENDPVNPAQYVCNTVLDAILFILEREGVKNVLEQ